LTFHAHGPILRNPLVSRIDTNLLPPSVSGKAFLTLKGLDYEKGDRHKGAIRQRAPQGMKKDRHPLKPLSHIKRTAVPHSRSDQQLQELPQPLAAFILEEIENPEPIAEAV